MQKKIESGSPGQHHIERVDAPGQGGAAHAYVIMGITLISANPSYNLLPLQFQPQRRGIGLLFQQGCPEGTEDDPQSNGIHSEDLLAILLDRHRGFQEGPFNTQENDQVVAHLQSALNLLDARRARRSEAGVLGQQVADPVDKQAIQDIQRAGDKFVNRIVDHPEIPTGTIGFVEAIRTDGSFSAVFPSVERKGEFTVDGELTTVTPFDVGKSDEKDGENKSEPASNTQESTSSSSSPVAPPENTEEDTDGKTSEKTPEIQPSESGKTADSTSLPVDSSPTPKSKPSKKGGSKTGEQQGK